MTTCAITATEARRAMRWAQKKLSCQHLAITVQISPLCPQHADDTGYIWLNNSHPQNATVDGATRNLFREVLNAMRIQQDGLDGLLKSYKASKRRAERKGRR